MPPVPGQKLVAYWLANIGIGGLHDAFQRGGVDGGGRWHTRGEVGAGVVAIIPIAGKDRNGVTHERGWIGVSSVGGAGGGTGSAAVRLDVVIALDVKRLRRDDR